MNREKDALASYNAVMMKQQQGFIVVDARLFIDHLDIILGASADEISQCACCGRGVVAAKCPVFDDLPEDDKIL